MYILKVRKAVLLILAILAQQAAMDKNFKPIDEMTGADTLVERRLATMVVSDREWSGLWQQHKETAGSIGTSGYITDDVPPKVDFKKNVVIAYFGGPDKGIDGYSFVSVDSKGKTNVVRIAPHFFSGNVQTNSYGFWIFPRPKKAVELELQVGIRNGEPVYQQVGKFEAPKDEKKASQE